MSRTRTVIGYMLPSESTTVSVEVCGQSHKAVSLHMILEELLGSWTLLDKPPVLILFPLISCCMGASNIYMEGALR